MQHHSPLALLADRDPDSRRMYGQYLEFSHWRVEETSDGREALARAITCRPDIIVTETRLFGISGYDLCKVLRRDETTRTIPIIVVTGDAYENDVVRAQRAGADIVLTKPCLPETLLEEMRSLFNRPDIRRHRALGAPQRGARHMARAEGPSDERSAGVRRILSHVYDRHETTTPPNEPPTLYCPQCDHVLVYRRSHIGGVSAKHPEQWDYYECPNRCGPFQFRERTRKLRKIS